jgi:hypothetical protein
MAAQPVREDHFRGVRATYSDDAIESTGRYAAEAGLWSGSPVIMFNPDSASRFNLMPFESQARLLGAARQRHLAGHHDPFGGGTYRSGYR